MRAHTRASPCVRGASTDVGCVHGGIPRVVYPGGIYQEVYTLLYPGGVYREVYTLLYPGGVYPGGI